MTCADLFLLQEGSEMSAEGVVAMLLQHAPGIRHTQANEEQTPQPLTGGANAAATHQRRRRGMVAIQTRPKPKSSLTAGPDVVVEAEARPVNTPWPNQRMSTANRTRGPAMGSARSPELTCCVEVQVDDLDLMGLPCGRSKPCTHKRRTSINEKELVEQQRT